VGTLLIAYEFIRETRDIQALVGMLYGWPLRHFLNIMAGARKTSKEKTSNTSLWWLFLLVPLIPFMFILSMGFYIMNIAFTILDNIHILVNNFYLKAQKEYQPQYKFWTRITLRSSERYKNITEKQVIDKLHENKIRIIPIIGVILLTIAFAMYIA
jgi:hypothetical protein